MYYISLILCTNYRAKTSNNVSEFTHSYWITLTYYSSPKHKSLIPRYLIYISPTSVHYNLEHRLAIVTKSFSLLNLDYTTSFVKVQTRCDETNHAIPFCHVH